MVKFLLLSIFIGATLVALMEAQTLICNSALIDSTDGSAICPTGTTLNGTVNGTCCYNDTSGCLPALEENGTYTCPSTLTLNGTVCCNSTTTTTNTTCRDLVGPRGYSDCPARAYLCNNTVYYTLMTQQCPLTCNRCGVTTNSTSTSTNTSTTCVDLAAAGRSSDCPSLSYLCTNTAYRTLMRQQCPRTCGFCTTTG